METLGEEPRPAQLISLPGDLDALEVVWQHPRVEFGCAGAAGDLVGSEAPTSDVSVLQAQVGAYAELLVALKELVRDAGDEGRGCRGHAPRGHLPGGCRGGATLGGLGRRASS